MVKNYFFFFITIFAVLFFQPTFAQETVFEDAKIANCALHEDACDNSNNKLIDFMGAVGSGGEGALYVLGGGDLLDQLGRTPTEIVNEKFPNRSTLSSRGLLGTVDNGIVALIDERPDIAVIAHLTEEWVPGYETSSSVYAQDGYQYLQGLNISDLWNTVRMIAYAMFVIILIWTGFMIMFRHKVGGQMMVTVMNTIPNVVVGLILVTFSFAIVGVVMDIGSVLINIVGAAVAGNFDMVTVTHPFSLLQVIFNGNYGSALTGISGGVGIVGGLVTAFAGLVNPIGIAVAAIATFIGLGIALVVIFVVGYASIKVFITLLKAYVGIIMDTVLAPLYLALAVLPGKKNIGMDWFYRVLKNVLTFVLVFFFVNLGFYLQEQGVNWNFPDGLAGGNLATTGSSPVIAFLLQSMLPLFFFFLAAEAPNLLSDFLPQSGGKGASTAFGNVAKGFGKIPGVGSLLG